jgi:hypothetical protein
MWGCVGFIWIYLAYCDLFFGLHSSPLCFVITTFRGMALPLSSGEPNLLGPIDRASLYRWTFGDELSGLG